MTSGRAYDAVEQARLDRMLDELLIHPGRPRPTYLDHPDRLRHLADEARAEWLAANPLDDESGAS